MALTPAYLESPLAGGVPEYRDWSVALGRRFRALKLWFVLRSYGACGLREKLREHIAWTDALANLIRGDECFELTTEPRLALLTFRYRRHAGRAEDLNALNEELLARINDSGRLSDENPLPGSGRFALCDRTDLHDMAARRGGWAAVRELAASL